MDNVSTTGKKIQQQIQKFAQSISQDWSKPQQKFIGQMLFGMQAARDVKLSNVARSLQEEIKLIKTENRLSRQMAAADWTRDINHILLKQSAGRVQPDTVLALDLSDIYKPFAKKMDYLAKVWDGSAGIVHPGYWLCEVIGAQVDQDNPLPLYAELYSQEAADFISENEQIFTAIQTVNRYTQGRGIWTMDRGSDRKIIVRELAEMQLRFVIRVSADRKVTDQLGQEYSIAEIVARTRCPESYTVTVDREGYLEKVTVRLGKKEHLFLEQAPLTLVVIRGFGQEPMLLITNVDKSCPELLEIYLTRWKCEEAFRFLKQEYHLEDVRVRSYVGLRNTVVLIHAVFYFLCNYLGRRLRLKVLLEKILEKAKRFFQIPAFQHYAIADGIYRLLFNQKWKSDNVENSWFDQKQLTFDFA